MIKELKVRKFFFMREPRDANKKCHQTLHKNYAIKLYKKKACCQTLQKKKLSVARHTRLTARRPNVCLVDDRGRPGLGHVQQDHPDVLGGRHRVGDGRVRVEPGGKGGEEGLDAGRRAADDVRVGKVQKLLQLKVGGAAGGRRQQQKEARGQRS